MADTPKEGQQGGFPWKGDLSCTRCSARGNAEHGLQRQEEVTEEGGSVGIRGEDRNVPHEVAEPHQRRQLLPD